MSKKLDDHLKEKGYYFCAVSHDMQQCQNIIATLKDFQYWAYIKHKPDSEEGREHYHFLFHYNGGRSIDQIAKKLQISGQYIQVCRKIVAFRRYMLHLDDDEKIQYTLADVHSSDISTFKSAILGNIRKDINSLFNDYSRLCNGLLTPQEFIEQNYVEISNMPFYQKIKIFELLSKCSARLTT